MGQDVWQGHSRDSTFQKSMFGAYEYSNNIPETSSLGSPFPPCKATDKPSTPEPKPTTLITYSTIHISTPKMLV